MTDLPGRSWWTLEFTFKHPLLPPIRAPFQKTGFCHFCSGKRIWFKDYSIFNHPLRSNQDEYRMDIAVKCDRCGQVMRFGIHLDTDEYIRLERRLNAIGITDRRVTWRHVYNTFKMHVDINRALELYRTNRIQQAIKEIDALFRRRLI